MRCWVHPFCYVPPSKEECFLIKASGLKCENCAYRITEEKKASEYRVIFERLMRERERTHYAFLKSKSWKDARNQILSFDEYRCVICGSRLTKKDAHIHHIIDFSGDEDLSPRNLVTLCTKCHMKLHPVFPKGMWLLGWPKLDKVKSELESFYQKVKDASINNRYRFKAPLEHLMMHICLICPHLQKCSIGEFALSQISQMMEYFSRLQQKRHFISDLKDGMKHVIIEGKVISISESKEVETRYGKTQLAIAKLQDATGEIALNLYGDQIEKVNTGDYITVENGYTLLYEGKLTLNVPKDMGKIITALPQNKINNHPNLEASKTESYPYHRIAVDKLEGSFYKGKFSEVSILKISKNQHYSCPKECYGYMKHCDYKLRLMNNPIKSELICTTALIEIRSSLPSDKGVLLIDSDLHRIMDSKCKGYRNFSAYLCSYLHSQAKQKFGYISRGAFNWIQIYEGTSETILLPFPEIPERENIVGIILELRSAKGGVHSSIETFDFRLKQIS